jgi:hypothetical protein
MEHSIRKVFIFPSEARPFRNAVQVNDPPDSYRDVSAKCLILKWVYTESEKPPRLGRAETPLLSLRAGGDIRRTAAFPLVPRY